MKTYTVTKETDGTWTLDGGIDGMDGYKCKLDAQYAMSIACWGGPLLTPRQAADQRPRDWQPIA